MGTNNAYVPTRGSRLYLAHWYPASKNNIWNGDPNDWGGGVAGDGKSYNVSAKVASVRVTPFNEANDVMYPNLFDQPDGCVPNYHSKYTVCHPQWEAQSLPPRPVPPLPV
jgi:hypothetical protein